MVSLRTELLQSVVRWYLNNGVQTNQIPWKSIEQCDSLLNRSLFLPTFQINHWLLWTFHLILPPLSYRRFNSRGKLDKYFTDTASQPNLSIIWIRNPVTIAHSSHFYQKLLKETHKIEPQLDNFARTISFIDFWNVKKIETYL